MGSDPQGLTPLLRAVRLAAQAVEALEQRIEAAGGVAGNEDETLRV